MFATQWRQEKEVRQENLLKFSSQKGSGLVTSSWRKERPGVPAVWWRALQWETIPSDMSTPTTSPGVPRPPSRP